MNSNQTNSRVTKVEGSETFEVRIDGFEGLPTRKGVDFTDSSEFTCFGHRWSLRVYPGGSASSENGQVACYLRHKSDESVVVQATFLVKQSSTKVAIYRDLAMYDFQ